MKQTPQRNASANNGKASTKGAPSKKASLKKSKTAAKKGKTSTRRGQTKMAAPIKKATGTRTEIVINLMNASGKDSAKDKNIAQASDGIAPICEEIEIFPHANAASKKPRIKKDDLPIPSAESANAKLAREFFDGVGTHRLERIFMGLYELITAPEPSRFGFTTSTFFRFLTEAFEKSELWLWRLFEIPGPDSPAHCQKASDWAADILAKHYACAATDLQSWGSLEKLESPNPDNRFVAAMSGAIRPASPNVFRSKYEKYKTPRRDKLHVRFVELCLNTAGYWKRPKGFKYQHEININTPNRQFVYITQTGETHPLFTPEEHAAMTWDANAEHVFPTMSESEFAWAWNRNGKRLPELRAEYREHKRQGLGMIPTMKLSHALPFIEEGSLPIKWVMAENFAILQRWYEEEKRTCPTLDKTESSLRRITERKLGLQGRDRQ